MGSITPQAGQRLGQVLGAHPGELSARDRVAWARRRYFEEGVRPTGLVAEEVIQSWSRCLAARLRPDEALSFNPVTRSRLQSVRARQGGLLGLVRDELAQLAQTLAGTSAVGLLLDAEGVVIHATPRRPMAHERLLPLAARAGVCLSEAHIGTNAPALAVRLGRACTVFGGEHYAQVNAAVYCAAAPVRDVAGRVCAVLDLSSEGLDFGFDAATLAQLTATAIENRALRAAAGTHMVVALQGQPALLDSPMAGLIGVDEAGLVRWINPAAARWLGHPRAWDHAAGQDVAVVLGGDVPMLHRLARVGGVSRLRLPSGLSLWVCCALRTQGRAAYPSDARGMGPAPTAATPRQPPSTPALAWPGAVGQALDRAEPAVDLRALGAGPGAAQAVDLHEPSTEPCEAPRAASVSEGAASAPDRGSPEPAGGWHGHAHALLQQTLSQCGGNVSEAARRLKVSRGLIYRRLAAHRAAGGGGDHTSP